MYFVALEQMIQRIEFAQHCGGQRRSFVPTHERAEPLPQVADLGRHLVELSQGSPIANPTQSRAWHESRLIEPGQKPFTVINPIHRNIDWSGNRVQKIEPQGVGDEYGWEGLGHERPRVEAT